MLDSKHENLINEIFKANHHKNGLKCAKLFTLDKTLFYTLREEVIELFNSQKPSDVSQKDHRTNWTKPYGETVQFSLFNTSGQFDDTSTDHHKFIKDKTFHYSERYPALNQFINIFPSLYNMRLNGMGPHSGLSPHEEHLIWKTNSKFPRNTYSFRARFHLPIVTNDDAEMMLDGSY